MTQNKLFQILENLEKDEMKRLRKVFESPYFVTNSRLLNLYEHLRKCHPDFPEKKVVKVKLFEKLYPGKKFNDGLFRVTMREFTAAVEEFLLMERLRNDRFQKKRQLAREYGLRNLYPIFERETRALQKQLDQATFRDAEYFREMASLNFDYFFHPMTQKLTLNDEALTELTDSIDKQFVLTKYRIGSELKNRERILAKKYEQRFLEAIEAEEGNGFLSENTTAEIYRALFKLYEPQEGHGAFYALMEMFNKEIGGLKKWDKSVVATQLINYAARQINSGQTSFNNDVFEIYKMGLENDLLVENNRINGTAFSNIVSVGCLINEHKWVENFINEYQQYLPEKRKADIVAMSIGHWHFSKKEFDEAYAYFANHSFDPLNQTNARMNIVRIFFERFLIDQSWYSALISQIENFEKFLYRNEVITESRKVSQLNSSSILKKLTNGIYQNKNREKLKIALLSQMESNAKFAGKAWLFAKVGSI